MLKIMNEQSCRRSPFFYVGDKFKLVPQLKENFPKNIDRFIEPFCGGGSVFLNTNANQYLLNDIDSYMIKLHEFLMSFSNNTDEFWNELKFDIDKYNLSATFLGKDVPKEYRKEFVKTYFAKYNKESYMKLRNDFNKDKDNMMLLYILLIYGFNRMLRFNSKGDFNLPVGNVDFNKNVVDALNSYFDYVSDKDIELFNMDFQDFVEKVNNTFDSIENLDESTDLVNVISKVTGLEKLYKMNPYEARKMLNKGDHIKVLRIGYTHHGIYDGCGSVYEYNEGIIRKVSLEDFSSGDKISVVINEPSKFTPDEIVRRAQRRLGESDYNLICNNCENFATWCRIGEE